MKIKIKQILILLLIVSALTSKAQFNPKDACRVENGKLILTLDLRWNNEERKKVSELFDIDSTIITGAFQGKLDISLNGTDWKAQKTGPYFIELSKPVDSTTVNRANKSELFMIDDKLISKNGMVETEPGVYGVNNFTKENIFRYVNGKATFYLPGNLDAHRVYLSGTFNNWSTMQNQMQPSDSGWTISLKLKPGKYLYKYIIDGKWGTDPNNKTKEKGNNSHIYNSVVYCSNHLFELKGYPDARKVIVTGSFNSWNKKELKMTKVNNGWLLPIFLRDGTYAYKFIVDNEWIKDPANKAARPDGSGNQNSYIGIGDSVLFHLEGFTNAGAVFVAGNFNAWNMWELLMDKVPGGWELPYALAAGNYEYKFIVDGKWMTDPSNPFFTGSGNTQNSILSVKPNYTFKLDKYPNASKVILAGSFNGWGVDSYHMIKKDNKWVFTLYLKPGKYTYKFVVDGKWILDPNNETWEKNEYNTGNSVLWINP